jgi:hypothetical protein
MPNGSISNNATVGGTASFGGGARIYGNLTTGSTYSTAYNSISTFVYGTALQNQSVSPITVATPVVQTTAINPPSITTDPSLYLNPVLTNMTLAWPGTYSAATISNDCTLNLSGYSFSYGATLYIDTSAHDVNLLVNSNFNAGNGLNIVSTSTSHNVYIYLTGSSSISLNSNNYLGASGYSTQPNIYIFGSNQSISLSNSSLNAFIYDPNGGFSAKNSSCGESDIFRGCAVIGSVNIDNGVSCTYVKPNVSGSILSNYFS